MRDFIKLFESTNEHQITVEEHIPVEEDVVGTREPSLLPDLEARLRARMAGDVGSRDQKKTKDDLLPSHHRQLQAEYQRLMQQQHTGGRINETDEDDDGADRPDEHTPECPAQMGFSCRCGAGDDCDDGLDPELNK